MNSINWSKKMDKKLNEQVALTSAATSLHHLAVRIADQRPEAFRDYSLADILCLFKCDEDLRENLLNAFGVRGGLAALKLIQFGLNNLRTADWLSAYLPPEDRDDAMARVYPVWELLGWTGRELDLVLAVLL